MNSAIISKAFAGWSIGTMCPALENLINSRLRNFLCSPYPLFCHFACFQEFCPYHSTPSIALSPPTQLQMKSKSPWYIRTLTSLFYKSTSCGAAFLDQSNLAMCAPTVPSQSAHLVPFGTPNDSRIESWFRNSFKKVKL